MLNREYTKIKKKKNDDLEISISEPKIKINLRGKKKEFFTKVGKMLSLILPIESNTASGNEKFNALWLSPDEWMLYFNENHQTIFDQLYIEISKFNYGAITNVSDQWICINIKGKKIYDMLEAGSPFNFNNFKNNKNAVTQTLLSHIDVIVHNIEINEINLFVRRSFSDHLCSWMNDSSNFI